MSNTTKAYCAITLQSLIIGLSYFFVKIALQSTDSFGLLAHRFTITAIAMFLYIVIMRKNLNLKFEDWKKIIPYSLGFPILFFLFQTIGLKLLSSSESGIIYATTPILTFLTAKIFLNEENTKLQTLFMILSVGGVIFINAMKGFNVGLENILGVIYIVLSALSFAVYNVFIRKISKEYTPIQISSVVIISGFIFFSTIFGTQTILRGEVKEIFNVFTNINFVIAILFLAIFSSFLTILLTTFSLAHLESTTVSLFQNVSTVISIFAGVVVLKEKLFYYHYIGIFLVLFGTIGFNLSKKQPKKA